MNGKVPVKSDLRHNLLLCLGFALSASAIFSVAENGGPKLFAAAVIVAALVTAIVLVVRSRR